MMPIQAQTWQAWQAWQVWQVDMQAWNIERRKQEFGQIGTSQRGAMIG
jgi:hypothetical protein